MLVPILNLFTFYFRSLILRIVLLWQTAWAAQCVNSVHEMCGREFGAYNSTFYPNLLGQWTERESGAAFSHFYPLRRMECSHYLTMFLCSTLSPACVNQELSGS